MFEGCGNTEDTKEEGMISETASVAEESMASEEISVESTEEVSEEISEEVVAVDYSADTIIALCDELAQKYIYDDSEYIKSLVIAANLDYITEEDLNTVLTTWGYTMEDLAVKYEEGIESAGGAFLTTHYHTNGSMIEFNDEVNYANRILFQDVMLNPEDKKLASQFDEYAIACGSKSVYSFFIDKPTTSCEFLLSSVAYTFGRGVVDNVYEAYVPESEN